MNTTQIDHKTEFIVWHDGDDTFIPQFINVFSIDFNDNKISFSGEIKIEKNHPNVSKKIQRQTRSNVNISEKIHLMQLTALRSINDEHIYNHMIVKDADGDYAVIDMFDYVHMFVLSQTRLEIVGNRFQHQHLLEMCK